MRELLPPPASALRRHTSTNNSSINLEERDRLAFSIGPYNRMAKPSSKEMVELAVHREPSPRPTPLRNIGTFGQETRKAKTTATQLGPIGKANAFPHPTIRFTPRLTHSRAAPKNGITPNAKATATPIRYNNAVAAQLGIAPYRNAASAKALNA